MLRLFVLTASDVPSRRVTVGAAPCSRIGVTASVTTGSSAACSLIVEVDDPDTMPLCSETVTDGVATVAVAEGRTRASEGAETVASEVEALRSTSTEVEAFTVGAVDAVVFVAGCFDPSRSAHERKVWDEDEEEEEEEEEEEDEVSWLSALGIRLVRNWLLSLSSCAR
jgi:hypothetical protein